MELQTLSTDYVGQRRQLFWLALRSSLLTVLTVAATTLATLATVAATRLRGTRRRCRRGGLARQDAEGQQAGEEPGAHDAQSGASGWGGGVPFLPFG